jgi:hypothetical protein
MDEEQFASSSENEYSTDQNRSWQGLLVSTCDQFCQ